MKSTYLGLSPLINIRKVFVDDKLYQKNVHRRMLSDSCQIILTRRVEDLGDLDAICVFAFNLCITKLDVVEIPNLLQKVD